MPNNRKDLLECFPFVHSSFLEFQIGLSLLYLCNSLILDDQASVEIAKRPSTSAVLKVMMAIFRLLKKLTLLQMLY